MPERNAPAIVQKNPDLTWKKQPLYDSFLTPAGGAGVATIPFFQVPVGAVGSGFAVAKTNSETNMTQPGQLGMPNQFLLYGFQINLVVAPVAGGATSNTDAYFQLFYNTGVFRFIRGGNKIEVEVPLDRIPTGPGPYGFASTAVVGVPLEVVRMNNGVPHASHYFNYVNPDEGKEPMVIDGSQSFRCEIVYVPNLITAVATRIKCYMLGVYGSEN